MRSLEDTVKVKSQKSSLQLGLLYRTDSSYFLLARHKTT